MVAICFVSLPSYGYYNTSKFSKAGGGGAKRQIYLLSKVISQHCKTGVVVGDYGQPTYEKREGIHLYRAYRPNETNNFTAFYTLFQAMRRADSDIYIYRGNPRKAAFVGLIASVLGKKWVYHVANDADLGKHYNNNPRWIQLLFKQQLRKAHTVITQTRKQQQQLQQRFGVPSTVIPNGYPIAERKNESSREYILWVGRLEKEQKRPHLLLDCAEQLPNITFRIIGVSDESGYATQVTERGKELNNVDFIGAVPPDEIHQHYWNATALVNTSRYEGFPNTFLEAWRYGIPVLSLSVDPGRYLGDNQYSGYMEDSMSKLTSEIQRLQTDHKDWEAISQSLQQYFEKNYSIGEIGEKWAKAVLVNY